MAALHEALESLGPTPFSSVPTTPSDATSYLQAAFRNAQTIIDSVPIPPPTDPLVSTRPRSSTNASIASNVSEISSSSARSDPFDPSNLSLQKEWGKPYKLNAKDNPLGMAVYKCAGKDGRGAWFARRSVHEGLPFKKWKLGLQREFPETLEVQGGPGEGNIRGIGGERRVERLAVDSTGVAEVYHLSAQFPGPTTPRDFVTLLLTSSSALSEPTPARLSSSNSDSTKKQTLKFSSTPRHFMVISKPCHHPDCPPRNGFIRGSYESVEFIREIAKRPKRLSSSMTDLPRSVRSAGNLEQLDEDSRDHRLDQTGTSPSAANETIREARKRGKTISFAGPNGLSANEEHVDNPDDEDGGDSNPVEWIMITRSDPGGNVPRFMVERGTPGSIVADASKFLDWACKKEHPKDEVEALEDGNTELIKQKIRQELDAYETNGHLAGLDSPSEAINPPAVAVRRRASLDIAAPEDSPHNGLLSTISDAAYAGLESYAPQAVVDRLPKHQQTQSMSSSSADNSEGVLQKARADALNSPSLSPVSSVASFASAEDHFDTQDNSSIKSSSPSKASNSKDASPQERELAKLNERKRYLTEKFAKTREQGLKNKEELTSKEEERVRKAEEKHAKEIQRQEEKYKKEIQRLEAKRQKEAAKIEDRKRKAEDKDEKSRLGRERDEMKQELAIVGKERDILREQVGALQRENTSLVVRLGKLEDGKDLLKEVKSDIEGSRSRSSSLKGLRAKGTPEKVKEATVLGGEKKDSIEAMK